MSWIWVYQLQLNVSESQKLWVNGVLAYVQYITLNINMVIIFTKNSLNILRCCTSLEYFELSVLHNFCNFAIYHYLWDTLKNYKQGISATDERFKHIAFILYRWMLDDDLIRDFHLFTNTDLLITLTHSIPFSHR